MIISLKDIERSCGKLSKYEDWGEENNKKFDSWLWCASQSSYTENVKGILGEEGLKKFFDDKKNIDDAHRIVIDDERKAYTKKSERLNDKYFKMGIPEQLSNFLWLGKIAGVNSQINNILKPVKESKEEEKVIKITTYKLNFSEKPKQINLKI